MAVLITGGAGYIGSATVELLAARGEAVVVLDDLRRGHRAALPASVPFYEGRIGDARLVGRLLREHAVEDCIHFAALAEVAESVRDPRLYFEGNVAEGIGLLGALLDAGVRRLVFSSTCATYGEPVTVPIGEDHRQSPANPYGWSKLAFERALAAYDAAYGLRSISLRYFNAAGATRGCGEDHRPESHLIPIVLEVALGLRPSVAVYGGDYPTPDGTAVRDYVHVADLAEAHLLALRHLRQGGASDQVNLGTGHGYSVLEVIEAARRVTGRPVELRREARRPGDPARLVADPARARALLGWRPQLTELTQIIQTAWDWRQAHPRGYR